MPTTAPDAIALRREPGPFVRSLTALLLRLALGLLFVMTGTDKLREVQKGTYPGAMFAKFGDRILVPGDVTLFARVLPYAETGIGAALIVGLWTTLAAFLGGLLLLALFFGHLHTHNVDLYPAMLAYLLTDAVILWLSPVMSNYISVDGLLFGWFWAPRPIGEYRRSDDVGRDPKRI